MWQFRFVDELSRVPKANFLDLVVLRTDLNEDKSMEAHFVPRSHFKAKAPRGEYLWNVYGYHA